MTIRTLALAIALAGCCRAPHRTFPMPAPPDKTCDDGWTDVYVWNCVENQHVVITRFRGEYGCSAPVREVATCGTKTPYEVSHAQSIDRCMRPAADW